MVIKVLSDHYDSNLMTALKIFNYFLYFQIKFIVFFVEYLRGICLNTRSTYISNSICKYLDCFILIIGVEIIFYPVSSLLFIIMYEINILCVFIH